MLVLKISHNFSPNASYKSVGFSKVLLNKRFEFVPNKGDGTVIFNLGLVLLLAEFDPISEEQSSEGDTLGACTTSRIKRVLALLREVIALYIGATIIQVGVFGLK